MATVQAITLKFQIPSARHEAGDQQWSCKFHLSGAAIASQSEAETAALGLAGPILGVMNSSGYLSGWLYYPANSTVNTYQADYESSAHPGTQSQYEDESGCTNTQAEVCMLWRAPTKPNSKGRMTYLFKYVHGILGNIGTATAAQETPGTVSGFLNSYNTGIDTSDRIPVAPDGTVPSEDWEIDSFLHTRQLRRGQAPKA